MFFGGRPVPLNLIFKCNDLAGFAFPSWPQERKEKAAKWEFQTVRGIVGMLFKPLPIKKS
jgi:hypothetical protein